MYVCVCQLNVFERLSFAAHRMRVHLHVICDAGPSVSWKVINSFLSDHRKRKQAENEDNGNSLGSFVRTIPEMVDI
ncbi:hypothetical protein Tco_1423943, partial [Tanacetum coccineum]